MFGNNYNNFINDPNRLEYSTQAECIKKNGSVVNILNEKANHPLTETVTWRQKSIKAKASKGEIWEHTVKFLTNYESSDKTIWKDSVCTDTETKENNPNRPDGNYVHETYEWNKDKKPTQRSPWPESPNSNARIDGSMNMLENVQKCCN